MGWISERWATFQEAAGPHWVRTGVVTGTGVYALVGAVEAVVQSHGIIVAPTPPKIIFTSVALALLLIYWLLSYAHKLKAAAEPRLHVCFEPERGGIETAIVKGSQINVLAPEGIAVPRKATYVRITINAASDTNVTGCSAAIVGLAKRGPRQSQFVECKIPQPIGIGPDGFIVRAGIPFLIDFLNVDERDNVLGPVIGIDWPYILEDMFKEQASFRFDIAVNDGRKTRAIRLEIDWPKQWNGIGGRQISVN